MRLEERGGTRQLPRPEPYTSWEGILGWREEDGLVPRATDPEGPPLAADSWLVRDGRVRGLDRHRTRFTAACADATGEPAARIDGFWQQAVAALPRTGDWFPRVELTTAGDGGATSLYLRIRPAPSRTAGLTVWPSDEPDRRTHPRRKGPDLALLDALRARAAGQGAQEALLTTESGLVLEGATTSLLWWEDETLCLPSSDLPVLPGVTRALIEEHAAELGVPVAHRRRTLTELEGHETWLVNALHGIRPVTAWHGSPLSAGPAFHAPRWQTWLDDLAEPITDVHTWMSTPV
jgi:branched-subunit amino acid aminotransferase/4-amino-4-deoxychorismate lyase